MSISFPALLIYLLPGFFGLWVFKNIVQEDLNKRLKRGLRAQVRSILLERDAGELLTKCQQYPNPLCKGFINSNAVS